MDTVADNWEDIRQTQNTGDWISEEASDFKKVICTYNRKKMADVATALSYGTDVGVCQLSKLFIRSEGY